MLLIFGEPRRSRIARGRRPGPIPWHGADARVDDRLAAAASTTSPSSRRSRAPYPNWDRGRPEADLRAARAGRLRARRSGHETGRIDRSRRRARTRSLEMPHRVAVADRARRRGRPIVFAMLADDALRRRRRSSSGSPRSFSPPGMRDGARGPMSAFPYRAEGRKAERLVGHGDVRRHRGDALRDADRHATSTSASRTSRWPPRGDPGAEGRSAAHPARRCSSRRACPMQLAPSSRASGPRRRALLALLVALVVQAGYLAMQIHLYIDDLARFSPQQHAYGSIYFTMLGVRPRPCRRRHRPGAVALPASARQALRHTVPSACSRRRSTGTPSTCSPWRSPSSSSRRRYDEHCDSELLQWYGLFGAGLAWAATADRRLRRGSRGLRNRRAAAGASTWSSGRSCSWSSAECWPCSPRQRPSRVFLATSVASTTTAPPPEGRRQLLRDRCAALGNVLFLVVDPPERDRRDRSRELPSRHEAARVHDRLFALVAADRGRAAVAGRHACQRRSRHASGRLGPTALRRELRHLSRPGRDRVRRSGRRRRRSDRPGATACRGRRASRGLLPPDRLHAARRLRATSRGAAVCSSRAARCGALVAYVASLGPGPACPDAAPGTRHAVARAGALHRALRGLPPGRRRRAAT